MEIFYTFETDGKVCRLDRDEAAHCVKVLRHRAGDEVCVIDGHGTMYRCSILDDSPNSCCASVLEAVPGWGCHPYELEMAVCPTKNNDRFEWFVEKAVEVGVDRICPVIGDRSERKVYKTDRAGKIALSAAKQSLKSTIPAIDEPCSVKEFIRSHSGDTDTLRLIAYCFEDETHPRRSIVAALREWTGDKIAVLIGPEGDFSKEEAALALENGFIPVHLGDSRLRTETAAVTAVEAVYLHFMRG